VTKQIYVSYFSQVKSVFFQLNLKRHISHSWDQLHTSRNKDFLSQTKSWLSICFITIASSNGL